VISGAFSLLSPDTGFAPGSIPHSSEASQWPIIAEHRENSGIVQIYHPAGCPGLPGDFYFSDKKKDVVVLLSGYVYNTADLCQESGLPAHCPAPELIAALFLAQGPAFVHRLNGDFALVITQPSLHRIYLFRDHLGIRPLAYTCSGNVLLFSGDVDGLCRTIGDYSQDDQEFLLGYFKYIDFRRTPKHEVSRLLPGHFLEFSENGLKLEKYWHPENIPTDHHLTREKLFHDMRLLLQDAIRIRADHRFTAGAHVSSGLDSGVVAALARREYADQQSFYGFSWSPETFDPLPASSDEREAVRQTCTFNNLQPLFTNVEPEKYLAYLEQPGTGKYYFSEEQVLQRAEEKKVNLIFSGWGGDEFISAGERGIDSDLIFNGNWSLFFRRYPLTQFRSLIRTLLYYVIFPALGRLDFPTRKAFRDEARYLKRGLRKSDHKALRNFYFYRSRRQLHMGLLNFYHLQERCESWYISGFRHGVEYRYPLLDLRIVEYMLKVPSAILSDLTHDRILFRELSSGLLPEEVRWRWQKIDPVATAVDKLYMKEAALEIMDKTADWKSNPKLSFIDFKRLDKDIRKFRMGKLKDKEILFRGLVYMKASHEFTMNQ